MLFGYLHERIQYFYIYGLRCDEGCIVYIYLEGMKAEWNRIYEKRVLVKLHERM
jgi:hypothetical protein